MKLSEARSLAEQLMMEFECDGWSFKFDQAKRRFGRCVFAGKRLQLSAPLTRLNDRAQVEDTIRHEIAHILVGPGKGHGWEWKQMCATTGADPTRCYDSASVDQPAAPYYLCCSKCGKREPRYKWPKHPAHLYAHKTCKMPMTLERG